MLGPRSVYERELTTAGSERKLDGWRSLFGPGYADLVSS
jgi:hypothetical protein